MQKLKEMFKNASTTARNYLLSKQKLHEENKQLVDLVLESSKVNNALNKAISQVMQINEAAENNKYLILAGLCLQNNGDIVLPKTFIDAVSGGDMEVTIDYKTENVILRLVERTTEETDEE